MEDKCHEPTYYNKPSWFKRFMMKHLLGILWKEAHI